MLDFFYVDIVDIVDELNFEVYVEYYCSNKYLNEHSLTKSNS